MRNLNKHEKEAKEIAEKLQEFMVNANQIYENNKLLSRSNYGESLIEAHRDVNAFIVSIINKMDKPSDNVTESESKRLAVIASFIQGIDITERAISEGVYIQAFALVRQELETIAALEEIVLNKRKDQKTPNVKHVKWELAKVYGSLSGMAHVSDESLYLPLFSVGANGDAIPASIHPIYDESISKQLYALHVALLIQLASSLEKLYVDMYNKKLTNIEYYIINEATEFLEKSGYIELKKD
ncbi:hypothetical protein CN378_14485 [Bacillus sp. AFS015802]|uniref:hypothetical protein n=1 Tax=Bacillus sp. AFS015802 TaxID=2033486 RepID=UPI000BF5D94C|nr:hypothetical protein [Bacillus sp. AFS015802]PFA66203.1 hypothetical protein CN378_14485 [Bacillus sp. AFS015802]